MVFNICICHRVTDYTMLLVVHPPNLSCYFFMVSQNSGILGGTRSRNSTKITGQYVNNVI